MNLDHEFRYIIMNIHDRELIEVEDVGFWMAPHKRFVDDVARFGTYDCCYAIYKFPYKSPQRAKNLGVVLILYMPTTADESKRCLYESSFDCLKEVLSGVMLTIVTRDISDLTRPAIGAKFEKLLEAQKHLVDEE